MKLSQSKLYKYSIFSLMIFIIGVILITFTKIFQNIDYQILYNLPLVWNEILTKIMVIITSIVSTETIIIISLIFFVWFLYKDQKTKAIIIFLVPAITATIVAILKNVIQRARPIGFQLIMETRNSLPSGHTVMAIVFLGMLYFLFYDHIKKKKIVKTSIIIIVVLVGLSRIYLGVHWFSDVFISVFLGISLLFFYIYIIKKNKLLEKPKLKKKTEKQKLKKKAKKQKLKKK